MVGVVVLLSTACTTGSTAAVHTSSSQVVSFSPNAAVLDFSAPELGGGTVEGAEYAGKDLAIWFWAPW